MVPLGEMYDVELDTVQTASFKDLLHYVLKVYRVSESIPDEVYENMVGEFWISAVGDEETVSMDSLRVVYEDFCDYWAGLQPWMPQ